MELNQKAWDEWEGYKKAIKKPIRPASTNALQMKLMRLGSTQEQQAAVDHSIANGYSGVYAPSTANERPNPHDPRKRTSAQEEASSREWDYLNKQSQKEWEKIVDSPIKRLHLAAAYLARLDTDPEQSSLYLSEKRSALRDAVAGLLREAEASLVIADLNLIRLVLRLFNLPGLHRLEDRAQQKVAA